MNDDQRQLSRDTWQAYNAMEITKQRHFSLLTVLENKKKKFNIDPTTDDKELLANLLRDHDEQVKVFTRASLTLKETDPGAHAALFTYIGQINKVLSDANSIH